MRPKAAAGQRPAAVGVSWFSEDRFASISASQRLPPRGSRCSCRTPVFLFCLTHPLNKLSLSAFIAHAPARLQDEPVVQLVVGFAATEASPSLKITVRVRWHARALWRRYKRMPTVTAAVMSKMPPATAPPMMSGRVVPAFDV